MIELRPYQTDAIQALRAAYARGRRAPCLVLPTAAGKTIVAAEIIRCAIAIGTRVLFVADRNTLIDQTVAKLALAGVTDVRVIQADRDEGSPTAMVTVASAQTLRTPGWQSRMPEASLVIWDECHGVIANTYDAVIRRYPAARLLGLTATPCRGDNRPLSTFDELVVGATVRELIDLGHIVPCRVLAPPEQLEAGKLAMEPFAAYQLHAAGQRAAIFCGTVHQARQIAEQFVSAGVAAEIVTATTPRRSEVLARFAAGQFKALCSVGTLTQGWDDPGCSVAILARRPAHVGLWLQICGRVLRPYPGKTQAIVIDLAGSVHAHGTPDLDRTYSLTGKAISSVIKDSLSRCVQCGSCFLVGPSACPYCGAELPHRPLALPRSTGVGVSDVGRVAPKREFPVSMASKRDGLCAECGGPIHRGDPMIWFTLARRATHRLCPVKVAA